MTPEKLNRIRTMALEIVGLCSGETGDAPAPFVPADPPEPANRVRKPRTSTDDVVRADVATYLADAPGAVSSSDIAAGTLHSLFLVRRALADLVARGVAIQTGKLKTSRYQAAGIIVPTAAPQPAPESGEAST